MFKHLFLFLLFAFIALPAAALNVIRDAETETVLLGYMKKAFTAAGLDPENAELVIINDPNINAFVAGGQTVFVHSGLITQSKSVDDFMFVISHEIGHIVGGHVIRGQLEAQKIQKSVIISSILGGLVAVAGGRPDAAIAVIIGADTSFGGLFYAYRQTEESTADRTAVDIMQKTGYSMLGFADIMKNIMATERITNSSDNVYGRTHPLTQQRVNDMERFLQNPLPPKYDERFELVRAKLVGFMYPPKQTNLIYNDNKLPAQYARAIALYRDNKVAASLSAIDQLIADNPKNPYFHELKGQILFETGQVKPAADAYKQAVKYAPDSVLINLSYANVLIESGTPENMKLATTALHAATHIEDDIPVAWQLMARAYDAQKNAPMSAYAMAEYYMTLGQLKDAKRMAKKAMNKLDKNASYAQRAADILATPDKKR